MNNLTINFLLLAAGQGQRFGQAVNKLLYKYNGEVIFSRLWRRLTEYIDVYYRNPEIFRRRLQQETTKLSCPPTKKSAITRLIGTNKPEIPPDNSYTERRAGIIRFFMLYGKSGRNLFC